MSGKIKGDDGNWHNTEAVYVKGDDNSWHSVAAAYAKTAANTWKQWFFKAITDSFSRVTTGSLGTSDSGNLWTNLRGYWYGNGSSAQSDDAASNYSLSVVSDPLPDQPLQVSANTSSGSGCGIAFWTSDAGSWFATIPVAYSASESYSYNTCVASSCCYVAGYVPNTCVANNCCTVSGGTPNTCVADNCCGAYFVCHSDGCCSLGPGTPPHCIASSCCSTSCSGGYYLGSLFIPYTCVCVSNSCCIYGGASVGPCIADYCCTQSLVCVSSNCCYGDPGTPSTCQSSSCCSGSPGSPGYCVGSGCCYGGSASGTRTRYYWALRLLKSISGVVTNLGDTQITNSLSNSNPIAAIGVALSGSTFVSTAYSDTALTSPIGSAVSYTNTSGDPQGPNVGIIKAPTDINQSSTIDDFKAKLI